MAQHDRFTISAADHGVDHITQCEFHLGVGMIGRAVLDDIIMQPARLTAEAASARFARQRDLQGAGLRQVAHAGIGAAPVLHGQGGRARAGRGRAGEGAEQFLAVGFDVAEEFVAVGLALRQRHGRAGEGGIGLDRGAVPVQVIAVGDPPAHLDAVRRGGLRGQDEDLVDRRQFEVPATAEVAGSASSRASPASQRRRRIVDAVIGSVYRSALGGQPLQVFGQAGRGFDREQLREFVGMQLAQAFLQGGGHCCK